MSYRDQKKYFEELRRFGNKLSSSEKREYDMFLKRHKDDEDLDTLSLKKLKELHTKYYINRERKPFIDPFAQKN